MIDKKKYFQNETLKRELIAMDIRDRKISHEELAKLISDPDVAKEFFGKDYPNKIPKEEWDEDYLEKLSYAVISEAFNEDYLYYLEKVAAYVKESKGKKKLIALGILLVLLILILIMVLKK